jgi:hypothetical protein
MVLPFSSMVGASGEPPSCEEAIRCVRDAALTKPHRVLLHTRTIPWRKKLHYDESAVLDSIVAGTFLAAEVQPHLTKPGKFVLIARLETFSPKDDELELLYVKFVLARYPLVLSWKPDGAPDGDPR